MTVPLEFKGFISFATHLYQSLLSRKKITQFFSPYFLRYPNRFDKGLQDIKIQILFVMILTFAGV